MIPRDQCLTTQYTNPTTPKHFHIRLSLNSDFVPCIVFKNQLYVCMYICICVHSLQLTLNCIGAKSKPQSIGTTLWYAVRIVRSLQVSVQMHYCEEDIVHAVETRLHCRYTHIMGSNTPTCPALAFSISFGSKLVSFSIACRPWTKHIHAIVSQGIQPQVKLTNFR